MGKPDVHVEEQMVWVWRPAESGESRCRCVGPGYTHPCLRHQGAGAGACQIRGITLVKGNLCPKPCLFFFFLIYSVIVLLFYKINIRKKKKRVSLPGQIESSPSLLTAVSK